MCETLIHADTLYHALSGQGLEDIIPLFAAVQAACKGISMLVQRAAIAGATGLAAGGSENAGGDQQKKLDVVSNDLLKGCLARSGVVRVLASEEVGPCSGCAGSDYENNATCYSVASAYRPVWLRRTTVVLFSPLATM